MNCKPSRPAAELFRAFAGLSRFFRFYSLLALISMPPLALSSPELAAALSI